MVDAALRHGFNNLTIAKWEAFFAIQQEIEEAMGGSMCVLLPGVVENTFR